MNDKRLQWWIQIYVVLIYLGIVLDLLRKNKANLRRDPTRLGNKIHCIDGRIGDVEKQYIIPGGATGLSTGIVYYLCARLCQRIPPLYWLFMAYFRLHIGNMLLHSALFVGQLHQEPPKKQVEIYFHTGGCGQTTASSPLWFLYFLPKATEQRDWITIVHLSQTIPSLCLLNEYIYRRYGVGYLAVDVEELQSH